MLKRTIRLFMTVAIATGTPIITSSLQKAEARPSTKSYTCNGVRNYVRRRGAVVMNTKRNDIYRRFVANRSFCYPREGLQRFTVPTKSGRCTLYICHEYDYFWD